MGWSALSSAGEHPFEVVGWHLGGTREHLVGSPFGCLNHEFGEGLSAQIRRGLERALSGWVRPEPHPGCLTTHG